MFIYHRRLYHLFQFVLDGIFLKLSWECAVQLRILLNAVMPAQVTLQAASFWAPRFWLICAFWLLISLRLKLYRSPDDLKFWNCAIWTVENAFLISGLTVFITFLSRQMGTDVSRVFFSIILLVTLIMLGVSRFIGLTLMAAAQKRWFPPSRVALLGDLRNAARLLDSTEFRRTRFPICGLIVPQDSEVTGFPHAVPVLGTTRQLAELINREQLDHVIVLNGSLPGQELEGCNVVLKRMGLQVSCALDIAPEPVRLDISTHYGMPLVGLTPVGLAPTQERLKRVLDLIVAALGLLLFAPLMFGIAIWIVLTSEGPVLYQSARVGKGGKHFTFLKFRSMYLASEQARVNHRNEKSGHIFKVRDDPRVTPIGRFLRRYSLDELPQLINVLRGEMSLVGPRPLPANDLDPDGMSSIFYEWAEERSRVSPGITGLWQISGRSDLPFEDMMRLDLEYIRSWSLALDLSIILETPSLVFKGVGAY